MAESNRTALDDARSLMRAQRERGPWLSGWLIFLGLSNAWIAYRNFDYYRDAVTHGQSMIFLPAAGPNAEVPVWVFLALGVLALVAIIGLVAIWRWWRWGLWLVFGLWIANIALSLVVLRAPAAVLSMIGVGVLAALIWPKRAWFE